MILSIDQGSSSTKACLFEPGGELRAGASVPVRRRSESPGAVRQDPHELAESCRAAVRTVLRKAGVRLRDIDGAGLANQGESFVLLGEDGSPRTEVISWQDVTGAAAAERLASDPDADWVRSRTGLPPHAMFPGPKIAYHQDVSGASEARFATLDTWLIHELDPSKPFLTDRATASRTMLVALDGDDWDTQLLERLGVPREMLAEIVPCDAPGAELVVDGEAVPLWASGYDTGLALLGHCCLSPGETKASFGTCLGVMSATGGATIESPGLLTAIAYGLEGSTAFALDGEIAACGALLSWAIKLGIAASPGELERLAASVDSSGGVVVIPAIQGLGAPHWRDDVQASIVGLTEASERAQLARAVFDALVFSLADVIAAIGSVGPTVTEVRVDGGLANSGWLMQRCADVLATPLLRPAQTEATAFGAAALAALGRGLTSSAELSGSATGGQRFEPSGGSADAGEQEAWREALNAALGTDSPRTARATDDRFTRQVFKVDANSRSGNCRCV